MNIFVASAPELYSQVEIYLGFCGVAGGGISGGFKFKISLLSPRGRGPVGQAMIGDPGSWLRYLPPAPLKSRGIIRGRLKGPGFLWKHSGLFKAFSVPLSSDGFYCYFILFQVSCFCLIQNSEHISLLFLGCFLSLANPGHRPHASPSNNFMSYCSALLWSLVTWKLTTSFDPCEPAGHQYILYILYILCLSTVHIVSVHSTYCVCPQSTVHST